MDDTVRDTLIVAIITVDESGLGERLNLAIKRIPREARPGQRRGDDRRIVDLNSRGLN